MSRKMLENEELEKSEANGEEIWKKKWKLEE